MAPKKGGKEKKAADTGPDESLLQSTAFVKKGYPEACAVRGVDPLALVLDRGEEGAAAFLRIVVHPGISEEGNPKKPPCTPMHVRALVDALIPYQFLQRLCFWSVAVRDEGTQAVAQYIALNKSCTSIDLTDVGMSDIGCKYLGEALEKNATLKELRLDHNPSITTAGTSILGECLQKNAALETLSLTFCSLDGPEAATSLTAGAMRAPAIRVLELKGNRFGADGVLVLLKALKTCANLFRIDLSDTGFGVHPEVHAALEECFEANTTCHEYNLSHNPVGDSCVYRFLGLVRKLPHLICMDVTTQCDPLLFKQIGDAAANNKKDWIKRQKKKGGKKGKGGKKKK